MFQPACVGLLAATDQDLVSYSRNLEMVFLSCPRGVRICQFPLLLEYKGALVEETGALIEFTSRRGKSVVVSLTAPAYRALVSELQRSLRTPIQVTH
jgi:hypothetical protein